MNSFMEDTTSTVMNIPNSNVGPTEVRLIYNLQSNDILMFSMTDIEIHIYSLIGEIHWKGKKEIYSLGVACMSIRTKQQDNIIILYYNLSFTDFGTPNKYENIPSH